MVTVVYPNGSQAEVTLEVLDQLIAMHEIISFQRGGRWVVLGRDPVRDTQRPTLCIPERRRQAYRNFNLYLKSLTA